MTSSWVHRKATIECDGLKCHGFIEGDTGNIADLWNDAKAEGWQGRKVGEDWFHYCPLCTPPSVPLDIDKLLGGK